MNKELNKLKKIAQDVYKTLGSGFNEGVFQGALAIEFRRNRIQYLKETNIEIFYKGESVGLDRPDFVVTKIGNCQKPIVLELKTADRITDEFKTQLKSYCTSLPRNDNPILKEFVGGVLIAFPKGDVENSASVKIFAVDNHFKTLIDEQLDEDNLVKLEKEKKKNTGR